MKKVLLLTGALIVMAIPAFAQPGLNLRWDDCVFSGASNGDKVDPCNSSFGAPYTLIASIDQVPLMNDLVGIEAVADLQIAGGALTDFWRLDAAGCRAGRLTLDLQVGFANPPFGCPEPWQGAASGGLQYIPFQGGQPDRARIKVIAAVPATTPVGLDPNIAPEWYMFKMSLLKSLTTTCAGCPQPGCIVLNSIKLARPAGSPGGDPVVVTPATAQHVTWQGGTGTNCPGATPTENTSWGQVKALYR